MRQVGLGQEAVFAMPSTGEVCLVSSIYICDWCRKPLVVERGNEFPVCAGCVRTTEYELWGPVSPGADDW